MRKVLTGLVILAATMSAIPTAGAQEDGDVAAGAAAAERWCSRCHEVGPGGPMKQQPPAFAAIAAYRAPAYIRANIYAPHSNMPEVASAVGLDVDDLVAYIASLEQACQPAPAN